MFDRVGSVAERVATEVSRRAFVGRLGRRALGLAAVIGGVLARPSQARAGGGWCLITNAPAAGCSTYKAVNGACPCGGRLVAHHLTGCNQFNC